MAIDFKGLLHKLASGDDSGVADTVLERKKNGPPAMQSTPAQSAIQDIAVGAGMMPDNNLTTTNTPSVTQPVENQPLVAMPANTANTQVSGMPAPDTVQPNGMFTPTTDAGVGTVRPPSMEGLPLDEAAAEGQQQYVDAVNDPIVKQSLWKDIGAKLIGASDAFVKGYRGDYKDIQPTEGWGAIKHNNAIRSAAEKLAPLQQQQGVNRQAALQNANIDIAKIRPDIMQQQANTQAARYAQLGQYRQEKLDFEKHTQGWKEDDRKLWRELQQQKIDATNENNQSRIDLLQQRQDEIERHNGVTEKQGDKKISNMDTPETKSQRQQITIQAKTIADQLKQKNVVGNKQLSAKLAAQLAKLKAQYDQLGVQSQDEPVVNATGEAVPNQ